MLAFGSVASFPSSANASEVLCSGEREFGKWASMRPAREISLSSYLIPELAVKALRIQANNLRFDFAMSKRGNLSCFARSVQTEAFVPGIAADLFSATTNRESVNSLVSYHPVQTHAGKPGFN